MVMDNSVGFEWCIQVYEGEAAKRVMALADSGVGYFIRRKDGKGTGLWVEAAFRRAKDSPTPEHLVVADPVASLKLDKLLATRMSFDNHKATDRPASSAKINEIRKLLEKRKWDTKEQAKSS